MTGAVAALSKKVPDCCLASRCDRDGCKVPLDDLPSARVLIDMDCKSLGIPDDQKRCDFLFVGKRGDKLWVAPIELKSGKVSSISEVLAQLRTGAQKAGDLLPRGVSFELAPVLAHGKSIRRPDLQKLRSGRIGLRGKTRGVKRIKCGDPLTKALGA